MTLSLTLHRDSKNISEKTKSQIGGLRKIKIISEIDVWPKSKILELGGWGWVGLKFIHLLCFRLKPKVGITYSGAIEKRSSQFPCCPLLAHPCSSVTKLVPQTSVNAKGLKGEGLRGLCGPQ